jgi:helicase
MKLELTDSYVPVADILLGSEELARLFTRSISDFGLRRIRDLYTHGSQVVDYCRRNESGKLPSTETGDDFIVVMGMVDLLLEYQKVQLEGLPDFSRLVDKAQNLQDSPSELDISPWLSVLVLLLSRAIGSAVKFSILPLDIPTGIKKKLIDRGVSDLWPPQLEAVQQGLFGNNNLTYTSPPGTGKSLLAFLATVHSTPAGKSVYIVPTRTLAEEAFNKIRELSDRNTTDVAISTRDWIEFDDTLDQTSVLVTTYEKLEPLIKKGKLRRSSIRRLVVDEVQKISDEARGIGLEFVMTKTKLQPPSEDPQIVAISGMLRNDDAEQFCSWLGGRRVKSDWKPVDLDEMIFCKGKVYHKSGLIETVPISLRRGQGLKQQREQIAAHLAHRAIVRGGQCLIAIESRSRVEELVESLHDYFMSLGFDLDLKRELEKFSSNRLELQDEILTIEPELSPSSQKLARLMEGGIAYHHAGMPSVLREIVERGVRQGAIRTLVTTTTFEAGVNLPVSHVVFPSPTTAGQPMKISTYRNLSGRAGRPGFDRTGESTIIALNEDELKRVRERYFEQDVEPLESAIEYFLRNRPPARSIIQGQILGLAKMDDQIQKSDLDSLMSGTWFWHAASPEKRTRFERGVATEVQKLQQYGFLRSSQTGLAVTGDGKTASRSTLSPLSTKLLMINLARISKSRFTGKEFDQLILAMVGMPFEMEQNDAQIKGVPVPGDLEYIKAILQNDPRLGEKYQRVEICPQYAAVLRLWIDGLGITEILQRCSLDSSQDVSFLEESLPKDAYWILTTLLEVPNSTGGMNEEQRKRIERMATSCLFGTRDDVALGLLKRGFKHVGRGTALRLADYLRKTKKGLQDLDEAELRTLFPDRDRACKILYEELVKSSIKS